jgi:hypothetical protein
MEMQWGRIEYLHTIQMNFRIQRVKTWRFIMPNSSDVLMWKLHLLSFINKLCINSLSDMGTVKGHKAT